ncbi:MAG: hypothetical protein HKN36_00155 [Hellea sp.]|nr:hypothetical protein [Hellea sp.]
MMKPLTAATLAATATLLFPLSAQADMAQQAQPAADVSVTAIYNEEALIDRAVAAPDGLIPVIGQDGRLYYNKVVSPNELPKVDFDLEVIDTYTFEHDGRVYTNKVVAYPS